MNAEILLLIFVGVSALAFVIQSLSMWRAFKTVSETMDRLNRRSEDLQKDVQDITVRFRQVLENLKPLTRAAEDVSASVEDVTRMVRARAADVDQFMQEMLQVARDQATKVDYAVTDTVQKFEQTTELIQRDVIRPAIEISAFFKGIKSGLEFLFSKRSPRLEQEESEPEDLFV